MVDVNKKEILCILEFRGNVKSDIFFPFRDMPQGELLKLTNCTKHIVTETNEKSEPQWVLKTCILDFG